MSIRHLHEIVRRQTPVTLPANATVQHACRLMRDRRIGAVLVTDGQDHLAGLFTGRDAVARVLSEALDPAITRLAAVMTANPDTIPPSANALEALHMMQDGGYRHLPVLHNGQIVGIVSKGDFNGQEASQLDIETGFWEIL